MKWCIVVGMRIVGRKTPYEVIGVFDTEEAALEAAEDQDISVFSVVPFKYVNEA